MLCHRLKSYFKELICCTEFENCRKYSIHSRSFSSDTLQENPSEIEWKGEVSHLYRDTNDEKEKKGKKATSWLIRQATFANHDVAFPFFFLFRQLCLYISDSLHLFTLFLTDSLAKCQTKSFENEYYTF